MPVGRESRQPSYRPLARLLRKRYPPALSEKEGLELMVGWYFPS